MHSKKGRFGGSILLKRKVSLPAEFPADEKSRRSFLRLCKNS